MSMVVIERVRTEEQAVSVREMAWEFIDWLRVRYPDMNEAIDEYLINQKFEEQLAELLAYFAPPNGECLLAILDDQPVGILMLKPREEGVCEMNRMFVRASARGNGVARRLVETLISRARDMGYQAMVLSALNRHDEAIALYRSMGFEDDVRESDAESGAQHEVLLRMSL
jgi:GNAT superfamily N-acetyltransferase